MKKTSHRIAMRILTACLLMFTAVYAEEKKEITPVKELILPNLANLPSPSMWEFPGGVQMAISSTSDEAQKHVLQGLNLIHGGWDFEAYRHFMEALKLDPECLMANFGVTFSLLGADKEFLKPRVAAADRTLALLQEGKGSELERGYVYALVKLLEEGPSAAANAFGQVARKYPLDTQVLLFESYFRRSGFDDYGSPKPEQELAQEKVADLMKKNPDSPLLMNSWLMMRTENLDMAADLPMARKLCELVPDFPPYQHLLGHYEWRSGNHARAAAAFSRCGAQYIAWMKSAGLTIVDCPEWVRAEVYRAIALASQGDYDSALAAANALSKVKIPDDRIESAGARMMFWEAKTLEARLLLRRNKPGDYDLALASLPLPEVVKPISAKTKVGAFYQGLAVALEGRKALAAGKMDRVKDIYQLIIMHGSQMEKIRTQALSLGEAAPFARAFDCLEILALDFKGDMAMLDGKEKCAPAYNWYSGARERQRLGTRMLPPITLLPMGLQIGRYYELKGDLPSALEVYQENLSYWPNDLLLLEALKKCQLALKDPTAAALTDEKIKSIMSSAE